MARVATISGDTTVSLSANWTLALARPDEALTVDAAQTLRWVPAHVPGTAGRDLTAGEGESLHDSDVWYRCEFHADGPQSLHLHGLAGLAEVFLDDRLVVSS